MSKTNNTIQAFWVATGHLSAMALGIVSAMILSRYLSKDEYGTYKQIAYVYSTLLVVFTAGLPRVFSYFLPRREIEEGKSIVWKISKILFFTGLLFSIVLFSFSKQIAYVLDNESLEKGLKIFSPIPLLLLPTLGIEGIFSTYKKTVYIAIYNTITRFFMLLCIVLPVILYGGGYEIAVYGWVVSSFFTFILAVYMKGLPFRKINSRETNLRLKEVFAYSLPLVVASLWATALKSADQFYISRYFGSEVFANFSNGFIELPLVPMVTIATSTVLMPIFSKSFFEKESSNEISKLWRSALYKSALLIYPMVVFFIVYAKDTMVFLYSEIYMQSAIYFRINMLLNLFNIVVFAPLFFAMGRTKLYANLHMILAISLWIIDYFVVYFFNSPIAIAVTSTGINILKILIFLSLASKLLKIKFIELFPVVSLLKVLMHNILCIIIVYFTMETFQLNNLFLKLGFSSILFAILTLSTGGLLKINYMETIQPILNKIIKK